MIAGQDRAMSAYAPVRPDQMTETLLEATFGRHPGGKLRPGWLMWLNANPNGDDFTPQRFDEPLSASFVFAGEVASVRQVPGPQPADKVETTWLTRPQRRAQAEVGDRILVEMTSFSTAALSLYRAVQAPAPRAARFVAVVLDRYDEDGLRVERVVAERCRLTDLSVLPDAESGELDPGGGALRWWAAGEHQPAPVPMR